MRAANIDMTDVSNTCPQGLIESIYSSKRMCTRSNAHAGCSSVTFSHTTFPTLRSVGELVDVNSNTQMDLVVTLLVVIVKVTIAYF